MKKFCLFVALLSTILCAKAQNISKNCYRGYVDAGYSVGIVSVSAMLDIHVKKNIAQAFILERYFFVSICPAAIPGTCLAVFLAAVLLLC